MLVVLFVTSIALTYACKQVNSPFEQDSQQEQTIEGLNINVKYAESYDQTEITYSRLWPQGISAGLNKSQTNGGELLVDYEKTREIIAYDEEGYMTSITEFLEGDGEMNMPEEAYNELKSTMPAKSANYDPIIRTEFKDGVLIYIAKSGRIIERYPVDKELYKVDPTLFDSLLQNNDNTQQAVKNNLLKIENSGVVYNRVGDRYVEFRRKADAQNARDGISEEQYVLDLQNGNILLYAKINSKGEIISLTRSHFESKNGFPILASEERFTYGKINNAWGIIQRTTMNRENIKIIHN